MSVTIKDIAEAANVSIATVSMVLNDKSQKISVETIEKVKRIANELQYKKNQSAASLKTNKTYTIGLIIPDITNDFFALLAKKIEVVSQKYGYNVFLCNTNDIPENDISYFDKLIGQNVDGIIYTMSVKENINYSKECYKLAQANKIPLIFMDRTSAIPNSCNLSIDNRKGAYLATKHLLDLGHNKIACLAGPKGSITTRDRLEGYKIAFKEKHIEVDENLIVYGDYHIKSGRRSFQKIQSREFTAIFALNDEIAFGSILEANENGIKIPEDISVVGFDNARFSEYISTPLTTVNQPIEEMGQQMVIQLMKKIEGTSTPRNITFQPELIIRNSTSKRQ